MKSVCSFGSIDALVTTEEYVYRSKHPSVYPSYRLFVRHLSSKSCFLLLGSNHVRCGHMNWNFSAHVSYDVNLNILIGQIRGFNQISIIIENKNVEQKVSHDVL